MAEWCIRITRAPAIRLDWSHDGSDDDIVGYAVSRRTGQGGGE